MLDKLLSVAATNAKLAIAAAAGAALVAGGSAVAIQQVADESTSTAVSQPVKGGEHASDVGVESRSDTATATIPPKPSKSPKASASPDAEGAQGVHGACVSAVAKDKSTVGRDHGKAVSAAAHSCPKGGDAEEADTEGTDDGDDDADETAKPKPTKPAKPAKPAQSHGKSGQKHGKG